MRLCVCVCVLGVSQQACLGEEGHHMDTARVWIRADRVRVRGKEAGRWVFDMQYSVVALYCDWTETHDLTYCFSVFLIWTQLPRSSIKFILASRKSE